MRRTLFGVPALFLIAAAPALAQDGAAIYRVSCAGCHNSMSNAPYKGRSVSALTSGVIAGKGMMKPRGGNPSLKDEEIRAAVVHLLSR